MPLPPADSSPISKLDCYLLWNIFSLYIDRCQSDEYEPEVYSLITLRHWSQVCAFWRQTILDSPSVWGKCINLDVLQQRRSDWRNEVLRRTGNAPLYVRCSRNKQLATHTDVHEFFVDLIDTHWARVEVIGIAVRSEQTLNEPRIWNIFGRPAPCLKEFSVFSFGSSTTERTLNPPANFRLFSDTAPALARFILFTYSSQHIVLPVTMRPFPSALLNSRLRSLFLHQPMELSSSDLLIACRKMMYLEELYIGISRLIPDNSQNPLLSPHRRFSLPNLQTLMLPQAEFEIFTNFLDRIIPHPGCDLRVDTGLDVGPGIQKAQEMMRILSQHLNRYFDHYRESQDPIVELDVALYGNPVSGGIALTTHDRRFSFRLKSPKEIPKHVFDLLFNSMAVLRFPKTLVRLYFNISFEFERFPLFNSADLSLFLLAMNLVTELHGNPESLLTLYNTMSSDSSLMLPALKKVGLELEGLEEENLPDKEKYIKPFFAYRHSLAPIEVLDLTACRWKLIDVFFLDDLVGLKIVWTQDPEQRQEYICGTGKREA